MATLIAEGFDIQAVTSDLYTSAGGIWTSSSGGNLSTTTQFGVGQSFAPSSGNLNAPLGSNETTVYGSLRHKPASTGSSTNHAYITFYDGASAQCSIRWNTDGSIELRTGNDTGTLIQSYPAIYNPSIWNSFQFKVVIDPSSGSIEVRVNGGSSNAITKTGVNTRGGTSNSYCNTFYFGNSGANFNFDDLYLNNTSGNNPVSWPGDLRAIQQVPSSVTAANFANASTLSVPITSTGVSQAVGTNTARYAAWIPTRSGTLTSLIVSVNTGTTANVKYALYDNTGTGGTPGTPLATSNTLVNPVSGNNTVTFSSPPSVSAGTTYFVASDQDASITYNVSGTANSYSGTTTYASFPATNPGSLTGPANTNCPVVLTAYLSVNNAQAIQELTEDGDSTYIYSSTVQEDIYTVSAITSTYSVIACQYYVMWKKSDAGSRTVQLSVNANSSGDTAEITTSSLTTAYQYQFKILEKDPTGSYWTATTANGQSLGISVTA